MMTMGVLIHCFLACIFEGNPGHAWDPITDAGDSDIKKCGNVNVWNTDMREVASKKKEIWKWRSFHCDIFSSLLYIFTLMWRGRNLILGFYHYLQLFKRQKCVFFFLFLKKKSQAQNPCNSFDSQTFKCFGNTPWSIPNEYFFFFNVKFVITLQKVKN